MLCKDVDGRYEIRWRNGARERSRGSGRRLNYVSKGRSRIVQRWVDFDVTFRVRRRKINRTYISVRLVSEIVARSVPAMPGADRPANVPYRDCFM